MHDFDATETIKCYPPTYADPLPQTSDGKYLHKYGSVLYVDSSATGTTLPRVPNKNDQALQDYAFTGDFEEVKGDRFIIKGCDVFDASIVLCGQSQTTEFKWTAIDASFPYIDSIEAAPENKIKCRYNKSRNELCNQIQTAGILGLNCSNSNSSSTVYIVLGVIAAVLLLIAIGWLISKRSKKSQQMTVVEPSNQPARLPVGMTPVQKKVVLKGGNVSSNVMLKKITEFKESKEDPKGIGGRRSSVPETNKESKGFGGRRSSLPKTKKESKGFGGGLKTNIKVGAEMKFESLLGQPLVVQAQEALLEPTVQPSSNKVSEPRINNFISSPLPRSDEVKEPTMFEQLEQMARQYDKVEEVSSDPENYKGYFKTNRFVASLVSYIEASERIIGNVGALKTHFTVNESNFQTYRFLLNSQTQEEFIPLVMQFFKSGCESCEYVLLERKDVVEFYKNMIHAAIWGPRVVSWSNPYLTPATTSHFFDTIYGYINSPCTRTLADVNFVLNVNGFQEYAKGKENFIPLLFIQTLYTEERRNYKGASLDKTKYPYNVLYHMLNDTQHLFVLNTLIDCMIAKTIKFNETQYCKYFHMYVRPASSEEYITILYNKQGILEIDSSTMEIVKKFLFPTT